MFDDAPLTPEEIESLWDRACADSPANAAELHFLASQYVGEARLKRTGQFQLYERTKQLPDFPKALESARKGWSRFCEIEYGLDDAAQHNQKQIQEMLLLEAVRRAKDDEDRLKAIHNRWGYFLYAFLGGRLDFFRRLGTALSSTPPKAGSDRETAHTLLNYWLTRFLWLMDGETLAGAVAQINNVRGPKGFTDRLKHAKNRWELFASKPALVIGFTDEGEMRFSPGGESLLTPK